MIIITELLEIDDDVVKAFDNLIPQLSSSSPPPSLDALRETDSGTIVGTLSLAFYRIPTGLQARIEDVVVDVEQRGKGVGELLTNEAIDRARSAGAKSVGLTSRPSREAANRLYKRLGFEERETNVYRYKLG